MNRRKFLTTVGAAASALPVGAFLGRSSAAASKPKIKIGQIGTGHAHANGVFRSLREVIDDYEIVGVVENDPKLREKMADVYSGIPSLTEEQLLNTPGLQAVVIETEVHDLLPTAKRCIEAGMHIHLDKPPGESYSDYKSMMDDATQRKLTVQMGYIYRYRAPFQFCYEAVRKGWFGDIFEVHSVMSKKVGSASRKKLAQFAGGSMFEIGCHVIDATIKVLGRPHKVTPYLRQTHPDRDSLVDNQLVVLEYPNAIASIRSALVEYQGQHRRQFTVCGEHGTFDLRPSGGTQFRLALERPQGKYETGYQDVTLRPGPRGFITAFRNLAALIREEKENDYPPEHDLAVHEATLLASGYSISP